MIPVFLDSIFLTLDQHFKNKNLALHIFKIKKKKKVYLSFSTLCQEHSHWKPAESKKDPLGVVWPDIKRSKVSQGQSDNGLNISLTGSESAHGATGASHALSSRRPHRSVIQAENLTNESEPGEPFLIAEGETASKQWLIPPMKNFADIEDMLILARPPQSELISCIGENPSQGIKTRRAD